MVDHAPRDLALSLAALSDVGLCRAVNEDTFAVSDLASGALYGSPAWCGLSRLAPPGVVFGVYDGCGHVTPGDSSSHRAAARIHASLCTRDPSDRRPLGERLRAAVIEAGLSLYADARRDRARSGLGTTATVAALEDPCLYVAHVGDGRAYHFREGRLARVTRDDALAQRLIDLGAPPLDDARADYGRVILQTLGLNETIEVGLYGVDLCAGDKVLLCTDGLTDRVEEEVIRHTLASHRAPPEIAAALVRAALDAGGSDNVTVIVGALSACEVS